MRCHLLYERNNRNGADTHAQNIIFEGILYKDSEYKEEWSIGEEEERHAKEFIK
jgi:hypothetical protein